MLDDLRKKQKVIIYVVAVIFIIGMMGVGLLELFTPKPFLGKVNGKKITIEEYNDRLSQMRDMYRQQYPDRAMDENTMRGLGEQTWNSIVEEILVKEQLKKHRIKIRTADIKEEIQSNPPQEWMQQEALQTEGRFDHSKYIEFLKSNPMVLAEMEKYVEGYLPRKKLEDKIKKEAKITLDSLKTEYIKDNDLLNGRIIWFDYNTIKDVSATDAEVQKYYDANKDKEFKKGPAAKLKYLAFEMKPSDKDYDTVMNMAREIRGRIVKGESFEELARTYSEDPGSKDNGGSLGRFGRGRMVPAFEEAAFKLKPGELSDLVKSDYGIHIIRTDSIFADAKDGPEVSARHILLKVETSSETKNDITNTAKEAQKKIKSKGIDAVAKELKLEVQDTDWVSLDDEMVPMIGKNYNLTNMLRKGKIKSVSDLEYDQRDRIIIAQLMDRQQTYYEDFEKVKLRIRADLEKKKKVELVKPQAEAFVKKFTPAQYFDNAEREGWKVYDLNRFKKDSFIPGAGKAPEFNEAALQLKTGDISSLIHSSSGPIIVEVKERIKPDIPAFEKDSAKQEEIRKRLEDAAWNRFWDKMKKDAVVIDNRKQYGL